MFTLTLVTPEKKLVTDQEIEEVFVPAFRGELNILPGHAPLMTTLSTGVLKYRLKGESTLHPVAVSWGYCQVNPLGVNVLAETAERPEELDTFRIHKSMQMAEEKLAGELDPELFEKYYRKIVRASVRQEVADLKNETK
jgi:F-type H+-transporting ATPase subunit epsilon